MAKLLGLSAGNTVVEFHGPQAGRNYFADGTYSVLVAPEVEIQVFGGGSVQFEENSAHIVIGERGTNQSNMGAINTQAEADPASWSAVGGAIDQSSGLVARAVTVGNPDRTWLRVTVVSEGKGWVHIDSKWN